MADPTRVAVDLSSCTGGGGLTYATELVPRLADIDEISVVAVLHRAGPSEQITIPGAKTLVVLRRWGGYSPTWRRVLATSGAEVLFAPTEIASARSSLPVVQMIRNVKIAPEYWDRWPPRLALRSAVRGLTARFALRHANGVIAVSEYAQHCVDRWTRNRASCRAVIYHGGPDWRPTALEREPGRALAINPYGPHKHLDEVMSLARQRRDLTVVAAGRNPGPLADDSLEPIEQLGELSRTELQSELRRASFLFYPTTVESFGHPLVEAMAVGTPIVAADCAITREIAGDYPHYYTLGDEIGRDAAIEAAQSAPLISGRAPRQYSWDICAQDTARFLTAVVNRDDS